VRQILRLAGLAVALLAMVLLPSAAAATFPGKPGRIVFNADGPGGTEVLYAVHPEGGHPRQITRPSAGCKHSRGWSDRLAEFSPNGGRIAYWHQDYCQRDAPTAGLWMARSDGSAARPIKLPFAPPDGVPGSFAFSADGRRIVVLVPDRRLQNPQVVVDLASGSVLSSHLWGPGSLWEYASIDWGRRGRVAIGGTRRGAIWTATARGGRRVLVTHRGGAYRVDVEPNFSPSGRSVVFVRVLSSFDQNDARFEIWRTSLRRPRHPKRLLSSREGLSSPVFSPDGRHIAFVTWDGLIRTISAAGGRAHTVVSTRSSVLQHIDWQALPPHRR
jgi:WD40 repeat protein